MKPRIILSLVGIVGLIVMYQLVSAEVLARNTAVLIVHATSPSANITVGNKDYLQKVVGMGSARVRLKSGQYNVSTTLSGNHVSQTVNLNKQQTDTVYLGPDITHNQNSAPPVATQAKINSLIQILPFTGPGFAYAVTSTFIQDAQPQFIVTITAPTTHGEHEGRAWLQGFGYDQSDFEIKYVLGST
ncbi:MAG TPA: hypothetical protein VGG13_03190 [Candidatus Saccharimonadales bacterium]|jgi:hypothetical protein